MLPQIFLLFIHWIGDYRFQYKNMALGKGKSLYWLTIHVLIYLLILTIGVFILYFLMNFEFIKVCKFLIVNGLLHWITDFFTSRLANYYRERNDDRHYWVSGFDQFIHSSTLLYTYDTILI